MRDPVAKRYASALFDVGTSHKKIDVFSQNLKSLASLFEKSDVFRTAVSSPSLRLEERRQVLESVSKKLDFDPFFKNFTMILLDNGRLEFAQGISEEFGHLEDQLLGRVRAQVTSSHPLDEEQKEKIKKALESRTGKSVIIETAVDPQLLGGVVTRIADTVWDGSLQTRLEGLTKAIQQEI